MNELGRGLPAAYAYVAGDILRSYGVDHLLKAASWSLIPVGSSEIA
jgi:hypothetical protein